MKKIITSLKEQAAATALALVLTVVAILVSDVLYRPKEVTKRGFEIELSADGKPVEKKEVKPVDLATMMKTADIDRGMRIFKKCATCHSIGKGEAAKVGPNLYGVVGRKKASTAFAYSDAMKAKGGAWDSESINTFVTKPKDYVPGTKMAYPGLKKPQDRADVILFLEKQR
jgi:cytochrome c